MQSHLKALGRIRRGLGIGEWIADIDVGRATDTLPVGDGAACRAVRDVLIKPARRAAIGMVIAGHDDYGFHTTWEIPKAR